MASWSNGPAFMSIRLLIDLQLIIQLKPIITDFLLFMLII